MSGGIFAQNARHGGAAQAQKKSNGKGRPTTPVPAPQLMLLITLVGDLLSHIKLLVNPNYSWKLVLQKVPD
jgi:hypothetical protein